MKLIEKYAYRKLLMEAETVKRRIILPNPENIRKVFVLWQPSEDQAYKYLYNYFQRSQIIFRNLCVYNQHAVLPTGTNVITPKDINWLGFPKLTLIEDYINTEFDVLLNIALEQNITLLYLTAMSRAHFKIGWSPSGYNFFDLNIQINAGKDAEYLAQQQIFYLEQLNKNSYV